MPGNGARQAALSQRRSRPSYARNRRPSEKGAGNAGCPVHPHPVRAMGSKYAPQVFTAEAPEASGIPHALPQGFVARKFVPQQASNPAALPFHQDAFGFPPLFDVVNCWTLLSPDECGETAPGLEFIPDGIDVFLGHEQRPASEAYGFLETPHATIERYLGAYDPWRPSIRLGDVMMFTKFAPHRAACPAARDALLGRDPACRQYAADFSLSARPSAAGAQVVRPAAPGPGLA